MKIFVSLIFLIFFPIKTFALSFELCQMESSMCNSIGGSECGIWNSIKTNCENNYGSSLLSGNGGGSSVASLPTITVTATKPDPFPSGIYYPWSGGSGGGGGNSGSSTDSTSKTEDEPFVIPAFTQTQCSTETTTNPIVIANGKKIQQELDFKSFGEMPLAFIRYYDSFASGFADFSVNGKWRHSFDYRLAVDPQGNRIRQLPNGENYYFNELTRIQKSNNEFIVSLPDGGVETYTLNGRLLSKKNAYNVGWILFYSNGKLSKVTHTNGRSIQLTWSGDQIVQLTNPENNIYTYNYNNNRLISVVYPKDTGSRVYHYGENGASAHLLSGISIDGKRYNSYSFNGNKAIQSGRSDGTQVDQLSFGENYTIVTNPLGAAIKYIYTDNQKNKLAKIERSGVNNCPNSSMENTYDQNGYVIFTKDWKGIETHYQRDRFGRIIQETSGIQNGDLSKAYIKKYSYFGYTTLITQVQIFNGSNQLIREEIYSYYGANEPAKNRIKSQTICSKTGVVTCRITGYGYSFFSDGELSTTSINTNGKNTIYKYGYASNLYEIENTLGHLITYYEHNALGQVTRKIYPSGVNELYSYDARGRIESITQILGSQMEHRNQKFKYGSFGVTQIERSGMNWSSFYKSTKQTINYNNNGTVSQITHGQGEQVLSSQEYQYSNLGQLLSVRYKEGGAVRYSKTNQHNQLGWTTADLGNNGQNQGYEYDANGNVIKQTDSLGNITSYSYDSQGNISQESRSDGSSVTYSYDAFGQLANIKDAKGNTTTYTYDGFGQLEVDQEI